MAGPGWADSMRIELPLHLATFLYFTGENIVIMTALPYITYGVCMDRLHNVTSVFCLHINLHPEQEDRVQVESSQLLMAEKMFSTLPPLVLAAFLGPWSDVHGRRLPLLLPYAGNALAVVLFLMAHFMPEAQVRLMVMMGFVVRAFSGNFILVHLISFSYMADLIIGDAGIREKAASSCRSLEAENTRLTADSHSRPESEPQSPGYTSFYRGPLTKTPTTLPEIETNGTAGPQTDSLVSEVNTLADPYASMEAGTCNLADSQTSLMSGACNLADSQTSLMSGACNLADSQTSLMSGACNLTDSQTSLETVATEREPLTKAAKRREGAGDDRNKNRFLASMSRLHVAGALGTMSGAFLAWAVQRAANGPASFLTGIGVLALGMLVVTLGVRDRRRHGVSKPAAKFSGRSVVKTTLRKMAGLLSCRRLGVSPRLMWGCFTVKLLMFAVKEGRDVITLPFVQRPPLSWPNERLAAFMAAFCITQSLFLFTLAPRMRDRSLVAVGLLCGTAGGLWLAFSFTTWSMMGAGCLSHMLDCVFPALRAILTNGLREDQVGEALSRMSAAESLSAITGPFLMAELYEYTVDYFPGMAFIISSAIPASVLLVGMVCAVL